MTTSRQYADSEGDFGEWKPTVSHSGCPKDCTNPRQGLILYRVWESHDGGYEDYHYRCTNCGHEWWVDGIDS